MAANPATRFPELKLEVEKQDSGTTVRAAGRITSGTSDLLENTLRTLILEGKGIVLDLASVDYVDSAADAGIMPASQALSVPLSLSAV